MNLDEIEIRFSADLEKTRSLQDLERLTVFYLGRKGVITSLFAALANKPLAQKKKLGVLINLLKQNIVTRLEARRTALDEKSGKKNFFDVTLPGKRRTLGSLHLVTYAIEEIDRIFGRLGFIRMAYPEVEWEYFAFESLNMPVGHPARDDLETFFIDAPPHQSLGRMVLTPHTSSGQVREMKRLGKPPIKMINIGKTYRPNWDASHVPMFHQFEGLCIDKTISIVNLKGTINFFVKEFFGPIRRTRLRPFHFQFTEPSFEVDVTCDLCSGTGVIEGVKCKLCKSGWLELGGAGMVHSFVLEQGGIDSKKYRGWAFGFGVERVMMMKEGLKIDDIRILYGGDIRFLEQF